MTVMEAEQAVHANRDADVFMSMSIEQPCAMIACRRAGAQIRTHNQMSHSAKFVQQPQQLSAIACVQFVIGARDQLKSRTRIY